MGPRRWAAWIGASQCLLATVRATIKTEDMSMTWRYARTARRTNYRVKVLHLSTLTFIVDSHSRSGFDTATWSNEHEADDHAGS